MSSTNVPASSGQQLAARHVEPVKPRNYVVYYDPNRCMGCWNCYLACAVEHSKSRDLFKAIFENPKPRPRMQLVMLSKIGLPHVIRCMHCGNPPCASVCPTGAIFEGPDGIVRIDEKLCIGCKLCIEYCPFGVIFFDESRGVVVKCDLCEDRLREGLPPACVEACPTGALQFGDLTEILKRKVVRDKERKVRAPTYKDILPTLRVRWW